MNIKRIDINQHDVFISWTSADRELKDKIVEYLRKNQISCLESDHQCSGDYRQWSKEAVGACNIFLPIVSSDTFHSKYVPIEIEEYRKFDNFENRIVPVWTSNDVFDAEPWDITRYGSSVILDEKGLTEAVLKNILDKVISLIINRLDIKYKQESKSEYIKLMSLSRISKNIDRDFDFSKLYINRTLCETDEQGQKQKEYKTTDFLYESDSISFIYGPAGCGKSQYINQIRENTPEDVVVISLPCSKIISSSDVFSAAFKEFSRVCGILYFYTESDFVSLINNRRIMIVFDGMDEIATVEDKRKLISKAEEFYKSNGENTILVFTGRNVSDADLIAIDGKNVRRFLLEKLREDEIRTLSENLFVCFKRESEFDAFFVKISDLNEEIRSNPLLLSQLAIIYYDKKYVPKSVVGIYDAISEITLKLDKHTDIVVPDEYKEMVSKEISGILKDFSKERYLLLSKGKNIEPCKIFSRILKSRKYDDIQSRSEFLVDYLESRAIFVDGEFYHKMFLEYFTAVKYYESAFDDYDEIEDVATVEELFSHYADSYWSAVIKMFLVKADSLVDENTTKSLYGLITDFGVCEYTILFDTCRDLLRFKEYVQNAFLSDIIKKSAEGVYPAYGPLFWYVPEYGLYEACLVALESLQQEPHFAKMLALVRDVCFIMGGKYTVESFTDKVSPAKLFAAAQENLSGVRKALCELFYLGKTDCSYGEDIYPRCFNVSEAKSFMKNGCGVIGRMSTPFSDELGLFSHTAYNELNDEFIGIVSCPYIIDEIESRLSKKSCRKLTGLILSSSENTTLEYIAINRRHIRVVFVPENTKSLYYFPEASYCVSWNVNMSLSLGVVVLDNNLMYHSSKPTLPDGLKEISSCIFHGNTILESINLPSSVKAIGNSAFSDCRLLTSVNIPNGVTEIGYGVFEGCSSLLSVNIPASVKKIKWHTFAGCVSLISVNISYGVKEIGMRAFEGCSSLTSITIPDGVTEISLDAFKNCSSLISICFPDSIAEICFDASAGKNGFLFDEISARLGDDVKYVYQNDIFSSIFNEEEMTPCDRVENMVSRFEKTRNIKTATIPYNATEIEVEAFKELTYLESICIPDSVSKIGMKAFEGCRSLNSINIPDGVTEIGVGAFARCSSLTSFNIPDSVTKIEEGVFFDCNSLTSINIPDGVTEIEKLAFSRCSSLASIDIPVSVTKIGKNVFKYCHSLTSITIPDRVTRIGNDTFKGCNSLISITIPDGVTEIGYGAFEGCSSLISITIPDGVTEIGYGAFEGCSSLTSITIPDGVTKIGNDTFKGCNSLISITIPDGVTKIGYGAFKGCSSLTSINISDGVTIIYPSAFKDCRSLKSLYISEKIRIISIGSFENCSSLISINIPKSVTEIGKISFKNCSSLTSIKIPSSVRIIGDDAFKGCTNLTSITINRRFEDDISRIFGDINHNIITFID